MQIDKFQQHLEKFLDENGSIMVPTPRYREMAEACERWRQINDGQHTVVKIDGYMSLANRLEKALEIMRKIFEAEIYQMEPDSRNVNDWQAPVTLGEIREVLNGCK